MMDNRGFFCGVSVDDQDEDMLILRTRMKDKNFPVRMTDGIDLFGDHGQTERVINRSLR